MNDTEFFRQIEVQRFGVGHKRFHFKKCQLGFSEIAQTLYVQPSDILHWITYNHLSIFDEKQMSVYTTSVTHFCKHFDYLLVEAQNRCLFNMCMQFEELFPNSPLISEVFLVRTCYVKRKYATGAVPPVLLDENHKFAIAKNPC